jgi:hypothetical protein
MRRMGKGKRGSLVAEDPRKKAMNDAWKAAQRRELEASIPLPKQDLKDLFDFLDREDPPPCDHSLGVTIGFLRARNLDVDRIVPWLQEHGGCCDCEVIYNVEEAFGEFVGR